MDNDPNHLFRFQSLQIWEKAIQVCHLLFDFADTLEKFRHFRCADQVRAAAISISNNIAEGSGSFSKKDFLSFLNYSH